MKAAWVLVLAAAIGCGGKDDSSGTTSDKPTGDKPAETAAPSSPAIDAVVASWKKGGFTASGLAPAKGFGKNCQSGVVNKVEIVICEVEGDAKTAEKAGFDWIGETTGSAWVAGSVVIAVADRKKADPTGKTINQLMKLSKS